MLHAPAAAAVYWYHNSLSWLDLKVKLTYRWWTWSRPLVVPYRLYDVLQWMMQHSLHAFGDALQAHQWPLVIGYDCSAIAIAGV